MQISFNSASTTVDRLKVDQRRLLMPETSATKLSPADAAKKEAIITRLHAGAALANSAAPLSVAAGNAPENLWGEIHIEGAPPIKIYKTGIMQIPDALMEQLGNNLSDLPADPQFRANYVRSKIGGELVLPGASSASTSTFMTQLLKPK